MFQDFQIICDYFVEIMFIDIEGNECVILKMENTKNYVKIVFIWSFSSTYFPSFGLNTERYRVSFRIQSECGKKTDQKNSE